MDPYLSPSGGLGFESTDDEINYFLMHSEFSQYFNPNNMGYARIACQYFGISRTRDFLKGFDANERRLAAHYIEIYGFMSGGILSEQSRYNAGAAQGSSYQYIHGYQINMANTEQEYGQYALQYAQAHSSNAHFTHPPPYGQGQPFAPHAPPPHCSHGAAPSSCPQPYAYGAPQAHPFSDGVYNQYQSMFGGNHGQPNPYGVPRPHPFDAPPAHAALNAAYNQYLSLTGGNRGYW